MTRSRIHDTRITNVTALRTPQELKESLPLTTAPEHRVVGFRRDVQNILDGKDHRLLAIVGPCSIHDQRAARDYARHLKAIAQEVEDTVLIAMRTYFEKPRTTVGWKGLINDPRVDGSFRINEGLSLARDLLIDLATLELPAATEALDPVTPQYLGDLVTWTAVGARTSESQPHREMASGLSTAVGFKHPTSGAITPATNAIKSARCPHHFFGITQDGEIAVFHTAGNPYCHIILRGGAKPNYDAESVGDCELQLAHSDLPVNIMIDCSHGNSRKVPAQQSVVLDDIVQQIEQGNGSIVGFMLESNILEGNQAPDGDPSQLIPGRSITDSCIDWPTTESLLRDAHRRLKPVLPHRRREGEERQTQFTASLLVN